MKLLFTCMECFKESGHPSQDFTFLEIRDDGLYEFTCTKGHKSITALQEQKFEILFDLGCHAILDGYYREAVSCHTASLERFYEFYIKVICLSKGIDESHVLRAWKEVSRQSERQLGAYVYVYLIENGQVPGLISNKWRKFRNDVIHKGMIPERKKAVEYGQVVLDLMFPVLNQLKTKYSEEVQQTVFQHLKAIRAREREGKPIATMTFSTILSISRGEEPVSKTLKVELDKLSTMRRKIGLIDR